MHCYNNLRDKNTIYVHICNSVISVILKHINMFCHFKEGNSTLHKLDRDLSSTITLVCFRLASRHISALKDLERYSFWMDLIISRKASDILSGKLEPTLHPHMKDIVNWRTLVFQLLSCSDVIKSKDKTSKTENLLKRTDLVLRAGELIEPQELRTKKSSVQGGTRSWMSDLLQGRQSVTSSTPIQLPLLLQLNSNKRTSGNFHSLSTFETEIPSSSLFII